MTLELVPVGKDAQDPRPCDLIFCHRTGLASRIIRLGQHLRAGDDRWSHVAVIDSVGDNPMVIEALTKGVCRNPLSQYRDIEYAMARVHFSLEDTSQGIAFLRSCLGQRYGWGVIFGTALRYLTPGRWPRMIGSDGTNDCSGLAAQVMVRGRFNYPLNPAVMTPAELAAYHDKEIW